MKVISLFSGAGGLDLGFVLAGHEIVWANDLYEDAVETYKSNIGDHIHCVDIKTVNADDIPDGDIVIGGFPCQGFSVANTKRNSLDQRNTLYLELIRVIKLKKPKYFLAENVKGILSLDKGAVFATIIDDFKSLGYDVQYKLLNAADYGVPQTRQRVIIVGVRSDLNEKYVYPKQTHSNNQTIPGTLPWVSVMDAIGNLPDPDYDNNLPNHVYSKYKINFNGYVGHRPLNPSKPAPTVTARGDDKGGVVILPHPNNQRRMTCRELATIQGFPLNYVFKGNKSSIYRQIGNAVPPILSQKLAEQFYHLEIGNASN